MPVILTVKVKLLPTPEQAKLLLATIEECNRAANYVSGIAWSTKCFHKFALSASVYGEARRAFNVGADAMVRVITKVSEGYAIGKSLRRFRLRGSMPVSDRTCRFVTDRALVSVWTVGGRQKVAYHATERQMELLQARRTQGHISYDGGEFYLLQAVDVPDAEPITPEGFLGLDLGLKNLATDSDGNNYSGGHLRGLRKRRRRQRRRLQAKQTRSAKRRLKRLRRKESRMSRDVNHQISKQVVALAKGTARAIVLEDLKGIRGRVTVRRRQRDDLSSWGFDQLQGFIAYKAALAGVEVRIVDPRNTSRRCSACGHTEKANRKTRDSFKCRSCGFESCADANAAKNIGWAGTGRPYAIAQIA